MHLKSVDADDPSTLGDASGGPADRQAVNSLLSLGGGAIAARLVAFLGTAYLARVLGPTSFGIIGFALALTQYFRLAVDGGFNQVGAREVATHPNRMVEMATSVILFRLLLASGAIVLLGLIALVLPKPVDVRLVVFLMGLEFFTLAVDTSWVYKGLERNRPVGLALVIAEVVSVIGLVTFVSSPDDVVVAPLTFVGGQLVAAVYLAWPLFRGKRVAGRVREGYQLFKSAGALMIIKLMRVIFFSFDVLLLGFILGELAVGLYTAAYRICFVVTALGVALTFSYLPEFTRAIRQNRGDAGEVANRSLELASALAFPLVVGGVLLARPLLSFVFGEPYAEAAVAFQLLLPSVGLILLRSTPGNVLLAHDRLRQDMWIFVTATTLNLILNIVLIPRFGITGAAAATLISETLNTLLGFVMSTRLGVPVSLRPFTKSMIAASVMAGVLLLIGPSLHVAFRVLFGGLTYVLVLTLIRGIPLDVRHHVRALLARLR
ncbi:MAG: flippase [Rhodothermales bacterium]|nr:flippase [Rhodothermales bacterium]